MGCPHWGVEEELGGGPGQHIPPWACSTFPCSKTIRFLHSGLPLRSPAPALSPPAHPRAQTHGFKPAPISEKNLPPCLVLLKDPRNPWEKHYWRGLAPKPTADPFPLRCGRCLALTSITSLRMLTMRNQCRSWGKPSSLALRSCKATFLLQDSCRLKYLTSLLWKRRQKPRGTLCRDPPTHPTAGGGHGRG